MKKLIASIMPFFLCFSFSVQTLAHSGRTDAYGGHKDNNNVSGLGYYHYHHGYSAHLHKDGVCPYDESLKKNNAKKSNVTKISDIEVYINTEFIPSVNYKDYTYVIAEDLENYGYDVIWDNDTRTIKIKRNTNKSIKSYAHKNMDKPFNVESSDIKAYLFNSDTNSYDLIESYNIGGSTIIKFSSLGNPVWDGINRTTTLTI